MTTPPDPAVSPTPSLRYPPVPSAWRAVGPADVVDFLRDAFRRASRPGRAPLSNQPELPPPAELAEIVAERMRREGWNIRAYVAPPPIGAQPLPFD